jgi:hypothetical protein
LESSKTGAVGAHRLRFHDSTAGKAR